MTGFTMGDVEKYFAEPDGKDCFNKLWYSTKWGTITGLVTSFYNVFLISNPVGAFNQVAKVAHFTVPYGFVGATFGAVTCASAAFRKKDDILNYAIGGACAGSTMGLVRGKIAAGVSATVICTVGAIIFKYQQQRDWPDFAIKEHNIADFGTYNHYTRDYSLRTDPGKK